MELPNFKYSPEAQASMVERYKDLRLRLELAGAFELPAELAEAKADLSIEAECLLDFAISLYTRLQQERRARVAAEHELGCLYGPIRAARRHLDGTPVSFAQRDADALLRQLQRAEAQLGRLFPDLQPEAEQEG